MLPNWIPGGLNRPKHNVKPITTHSPAYSEPKPGHWSPEHGLPAVYTIGIPKPKPTISSTKGRPSETVSHGKPVGTASDIASVSSASAVEPSPASVVDEKPSATHQSQTKAPIVTGSYSISAMPNAQDVFQPIATGPIPRTISARDDHPVPKKGIKSEVPIETNKFYSGLFLGTQTNATFTHPYELAWAKGTGNLSSWGMAITHVEGGLAKGPKNEKIPGHPVSFYVNPIGIQSIILGATELANSTVLNTENPLPFSANAVLRPRDGAKSSITFPVVQGMGYVTGIYSNLQPVIQSSVHYKEVVSAGSPRQGIFKYVITLEDNSIWMLYLTPDDGRDPDLKLESSTDLRGPRGWSGTIQVAKNPAGRSGEKLYDNSAGVFALEGAVAGQVSEKTGTYNLLWAKGGKDAQNTPLMMFALPHHVESFDRSTQSRMTNITLRTTTKGNATAVIGEVWTMIEPDLPIDLGLEPRSLGAGRISAIPHRARQVILDAARKDLNNSVSKESDLNSMYFSGKTLSKYAVMVHTVSKIGGDPHLASATLQDLKHAFSRFVNNTQQFPLVYDNVWKGVVSSASYDGGDVGADFGNTVYNDHHFHYGYFIHAAAIIGNLDPAWVEHNKDWVNMLVRDAGNAAGNDPYFPFSRGFDWFHGHSWAKGLFESFDGKDQESSSEDTMFAYALKMWGKTVGDASMEARGNLMLGILRRTLHNYFLLESDNKNHPADFIANKVTGIVSPILSHSRCH
ncbi:endo-1,3-beta-glucanase Engl1 [Aspergillus taichungensis]|uniref:glucan endo-1,3-beta-D-glucosidase n=1 Tax=Aspergillus taichungensis TaxID=482145 RepID=A0A2J5I3P5_9EURO|nr:endo-1,3-beta-glucanase Engl1 [Aspergillus taichungensis]